MHWVLIVVVVFTGGNVRQLEHYYPTKQECHSKAAYTKVQLNLATNLKKHYILCKAVQNQNNEW